MNLISKFKREIILFILISAFYFILRLLFLERLPIFTDEAIYLRWAQIALHDSAWRFISLTDGKQPLFVWIAMIFMKFIEDPLLAGRLVSVISGFFTMAGLFLLTYELFKNKNVAFFSSMLYVFYPFAQVLDRMALMDGMVGTFAVWGLYFSILLVRRIRLDIAYTLALIIGGGILTKSSGFFTIYLIPFTLLFFDFKKRPVAKRFIMWAIFVLFSISLGYLFYNVLRLSPLYEMIAIKNATFVYPFSEWFQHPFVFLGSNLSGLISWLLQYLTPAYTVLILLSILFISKHFKEKTILFLYFALPFIALALFGKLIYPRHFYFMPLFLLPLAAWSLDFIFDKSKKFFPGNLFLAWEALIILIVISYPIYVSVLFAVDPIKAPIADADRAQYVNNWSAGWGVKESVAFFKQKAQKEKIFIATEGTFGLMPETMEMYLVSNPNVTIKGYWPIDNMLPKEALDYAKKMPSYFIFYQPQHVIIPSDFPLKLIFQIREGNSDYFYRVYQITPHK